MIVLTFCNHKPVLTNNNPMMINDFKIISSPMIVDSSDQLGVHSVSSNVRLVVHLYFIRALVLEKLFLDHHGWG